MNRVNRVLLVVGMVTLCVGTFYLGRYSERLRLLASGSSYRCFILEGMLCQLRARKVPQVGLALEMRLDEEVATLARIRQRSLANRVFVPARSRNQVEVVLRRFAKYRTTAGATYEGTPLWQIDRFEDPSSELLDQLERMNEQRSRINALVKSVYAEFVGKEPLPERPKKDVEKESEEAVE